MCDGCDSEIKAEKHIDVNYLTLCPSIIRKTTNVAHMIKITPAVQHNKTFCGITCMRMWLGTGIE